MEDVVSFLIPSILSLFTNNFAKSLFVCIHQSASNLTQFYLLNVFFVQKSNGMVKKIGQNFFGVSTVFSFLLFCYFFSLVSRQFTGSGFVEYNVKSAIYSDESELKLTFRTVQPSGLLFQSTSSGGDWADYITLEIVGGRLRCVYMYLITHCSR